jgi:hypothetical protein
MINSIHSIPSDRPRGDAKPFNENNSSILNAPSKGKVNSRVQINVSVVNANRELKGVS